MRRNTGNRKSLTNIKAMQMKAAAFHPHGFLPVTGKTSMQYNDNIDLHFDLHFCDQYRLFFSDLRVIHAAKIENEKPVNTVFIGIHGLFVLTRGYKKDIFAVSAERNELM